MYDMIHNQKCIKYAQSLTVYQLNLLHGIVRKLVKRKLKIESRLNAQSTDDALSTKAFLRETIGLVGMISELSGL